MSNLENYQDFEALLEEYMPVQEEKTRKKVEGIIAAMDRNYAYLDVAGEPMNVRVRTEELRNYNVGDKVEVAIVGEDSEEEVLIGSRRRIDAEEGFKDIQAALENKSIIKGKISKRTKGGYIVQAFYQEGFLPNSLSEIPLKDGDKFVGKDIEVIVKEIKDEKKILFSKKDITLLKEENEFATLKIGEVVDAVVTDVLEFGLVVKICAIKGFVHISEISWKKTENLSSLYKKGDEIQGEIIELDPAKRNVKLSIKALSRNPWEILGEKVHVGDTVEAKVTKIVPYGVFAEVIDGVEGLIHSSDFTWNKKKININNFVKVGDEITVQVTEFTPAERKLKLGIKQLSKNPWENSEERFAVGTVLTGKVIEVKPFGIFVQVEDGVDSFIHNSDFSHTGNKKYNLGDVVEFQVIELHPEEQKIKGSIKALTKSPWDLAMEKYKVGDIVKREIKNLQEFGMFIKLENGVDGFIPTQMASKDFIKNLKDRFTPGEEVEAEIVEIDSEKKRIKLSIKKLEFAKEKRENADLIAKYGVSSSEK